MWSGRHPAESENEEEQDDQQEDEQQNTNGAPLTPVWDKEGERSEVSP